MATLSRAHHAASVARHHGIGALRQLGPGVYNRFIVGTDDLKGQSPFVLLVEDFIAPTGDYHMHPHRGLETVTLILDGEIAHRDHLGTSGVVGPLQVQWMTAGRGIFHGGRPGGAGPVHALQLWLNLPARLKGAAPGTREQKVPTTRSADGKVLTFGVDAGAEASPWSQWPMALTHARIAAGDAIAVDISPGARLFFYILQGEVFAGADRKRLAAGEVGWVDARDAAQALDVKAITETRIVAYAGQPIDEPIVAEGPFVMNTREEIRQAFRALQDGSFLRP